MARATATPTPESSGKIPLIVTLGEAAPADRAGSVVVVDGGGIRVVLEVGPGRTVVVV